MFTVGTSFWFSIASLSSSWQDWCVYQVTMSIVKIKGLYRCWKDSAVYYDFATQIQFGVFSILRYFFRLPESQSWSQNSQRLFSKGLELTIAQQLPHVLSRSIIHRGPLALRLHHVGLDHSRFCCRPATGPEFGGIWCWERTFLIEVGVGESEWIEWRMGWTTWVDFR